MFNLTTQQKQPDGGGSTPDLAPRPFNDGLFPLSIGVLWWIGNLAGPFGGSAYFL